MSDKLDFAYWLEKYFLKDGEHYIWKFTYEVVHEDERTRWRGFDMLDEYTKYENNDKDSYIGLEKYEE